MLLQRGRPKGKRVFSVTIALTQEQIDYLQSQPNASELVRKILDDLIEARRDVEGKLGVISLNKQLAHFEQERKKLFTERMNYLNENSHLWKKTDNGNTDWLDRDTYTPKPLDTEDGQIAAHVLKGYDDAIASLDLKIAEIKKQILQRE